MKPLITTIIPTYQRPKLLKKAIQSVLDQSLPHLQVCVYDNASGDETFDIVNEWRKKDARVHYFCHEKNIGSNANFRFGLHQVKTPFFSFLSDDDLLFPWFYKEALEQLQRFQKAAFFEGATVLLDEKLNILSLGGTGIKEGYHDAASALPNNSWTSFLFRTKEAQQTDLNTEIFHIDGDFLIRMYAYYPFILSHQPCAIFRVHSEGISSNCSSQELIGHYQKMILSFNKDPKIPKKMTQEVELFLNHSFASHLLKKSLRDIYQKKFQEAFDEKALLEKHLQKSQKILLLKLLLFLCQKSSLIHQIYCYLIDWLRFFKKRKKKDLLSDECHSFIEKLNNF
jgi:glycosyltransferase involved in cell wall biosynthesis